MRETVSGENGNAASLRHGKQTIGIVLNKRNRRILISNGDLIVICFSLVIGCYRLSLGLINGIKALFN